MSSTKRSAESTTGCSIENSDSGQPPTKATKLLNRSENNSNVRYDSTTSRDSQLAKIESMVSWIKDLGAVLPSIEIKPCPKGGGFGAFATTDIPPGGLVGRIPNEVIMTVEKSAKSKVGRAVASTNFTNNENQNDDTTRNTCKNDIDDNQDNITKEIIPCRPTPEFVLWLDMCHGRQDTNHPHHPYLVSLPSDPPDLPSWPSEARSKLEGTNLGIAASKVSKELKQQYDKWMPTLHKSDPKLFAESGFQHTDIMWASGMYYSRRFPSVLLLDEENGDKQQQQHQNCKLEPEINTATGSNTAKNSISDEDKNMSIGDDNDDVENYHTLSNHSNRNVGIMLPYLDMLNHRQHQQITWCREKTGHVSFRTGPKSNCDLTQAYTESYTGPTAEQQQEGGGASINADNSGSIPAGSEVYNNYGPKGNEMLMMMYGFALPDNIHDSYGLHLVLMTAVTTQPNNNKNNDGNDKMTNAEMNILEKKDLGTYQIHRRDSPIDPQFPPGLWKALNEMFIEEEQEEEVQQQQNYSGGTKPTDAAAAAATANDNNKNIDDKAETAEAATEEEEVQTIEVSPEAVEFLLETLKRRIQPFVSTREEDSLCETDIAKYRNGQRIVLEEAIETLTQMLPEEEDEEMMNG